MFENLRFNNFCSEIILIKLMGCLIKDKIDNRNYFNLIKTAFKAIYDLNYLRDKIKHKSIWGIQNSKIYTTNKCVLYKKRR